jgi:hypothetical protein
LDGFEEGLYRLLVYQPITLLQLNEIVDQPVWVLLGDDLGDVTVFLKLCVATVSVDHKLLLTIDILE